MRKPRLKMDADALAHASLVRIGAKKKKLKALNDYYLAMKRLKHWEKLKVFYPFN